MKRLFALCLALVMALSLAACGGSNNDGAGTGNPTESAVVLDLPAIYEKMTQAATMAEMYQAEGDLLLDMTGIKAADVKTALVYDCLEYPRIDEIWLVEAVDAAAAATIKDLAQRRLEQLDSESASYNLEQNAVVKKAQLLQQGNYIALIISPDVEALAQVFRTEAGL